MRSKIPVAFQKSIAILILISIFLVKAQDSDYSLDYDKYIFFHWKGALTSHSLTLRIFPIMTELGNTAYKTYVAVYTKSDTNNVQLTSLEPVVFEESDYPVTEVVLDSLSAKTQYFYSFIFMKNTSMTNDQFQAVYQQGVPSEFRFSTSGIALTAHSFKFGAASCASTGSNSSIFTTVQNQNFDFFIHMGDLHYSDIAENSTDKIYNAYYKVFSSTTQKPFFQSTPIFYVWDDHDFGSGNANGTSPSNPAVNSAYRNFVPHGTLKNTLPSDDSTAFPDTAPKSTNGDYLEPQTSQSSSGVFQSFIVGRCLFIIMDLRSFKDVKDKDILGDEQTTWLENQFRYASYNSGIVQVFIVSSFPWIHTGKPTEWSPYPVVQENIAKMVDKYIYGSGKDGKKIMMLSGDAHMIAFDDGSNNHYGDFPVLQAAALDRYGSCKGGPYSHGYSTGPNHYSSIEVVDSGDEDHVCIKINLKDKDENIIRYDTCDQNKYPTNLSYCPVTTPPTTKTEDGGFTLTLIISIGIILVGIIAYVIYSKSRRQQEREIQPAEVHQYFEMTEPGQRRFS